MELTPEELAYLGDIISIDAIGPGDWDKYAIHLLDPLYDLFLKEATNLVGVKASRNCREVRLTSKQDVAISIKTVKNLTERIFSFNFTGSGGSVLKVFDDTFYSFRASLLHFISRAYQKESTALWRRHDRLVGIIEEGRI